jgi:hypothetical protein
MTTPAAANFYLAKHLLEHEGRPNAVYNPHNKPIESLPVIFGFNNGGSAGWYSAVLLAEDGTGLGGHIYSHEGYMRHDLGILEGSRPDRHEDFRKHYPDGYRMAFVSVDEVETCKPLLDAYELNQKKAQEESSKADEVTS